MEDYPQNLTEFEARFSSEEACREYLFRLRWPDGFRCPGCGCGKSWPLRKVLLQCAACGRQTSVTAGTIFQDTRSPLPLWFRAMWWVTTQKTGASALGLQRVLGLNRYLNYAQIRRSHRRWSCGDSGTRVNSVISQVVFSAVSLPV